MCGPSPSNPGPSALSRTPEREASRGLDAAVRELEQLKRQAADMVLTIGDIITGLQDQSREMRARPFESEARQ